MSRESRENTRPGEENTPSSADQEVAARNKARTQRVPLGKHRARLAVDPTLIPPGKVGRWINDHPGRLIQAEQGGYAFVENPHAQVGEGEDRRDPLSTKVCTVVGSKQHGSPLLAYLMVIDKDLYDEDQRAKQGQVDEIDKAIKEGAIASEHLDKEDMGRTYIPKEGIRYET